MVNSLVKMKSDDIVNISCDPSGSHVITTFMTSTTVPIKKKQKLVVTLEVIQYVCMRVWPESFLDVLLCVFDHVRIYAYMYYAQHSVSMIVCFHYAHCTG